MSIADLIKSNKVIPSPDGYILVGAKEAIEKNIKDYPTYDDLLKRHNTKFDVKNNIKALCLL